MINSLRTTIVTTFLVCIAIAGAHAAGYTAAASSELGAKYGAAKAIDGELNTAWVEGKKDDGLGQWLELRFAKPAHLVGLMVWPGYQKSDKLLVANNTPARLKVTFDGGSPADMALPMRASVAPGIADPLGRGAHLYQPLIKGRNENAAPRIVIFGYEREGVKKLRLEIKEVYHGAKYRDTAISEVIPIYVRPDDKWASGRKLDAAIRAAHHVAHGAYKELLPAAGFITGPSRTPREIEAAFAKLGSVLRCAPPAALADSLGLQAAGKIGAKAYKKLMETFAPDQTWAMLEAANEPVPALELQAATLAADECRRDVYLRLYLDAASTGPMKARGIQYVIEEGSAIH